MKTLSDRNDNSIRILLVTIWAGSGVLAWLSTLVTQQTTVSGSTITMLAVVVAGIGVALRSPILATESKTSELSEHVVLLLGYAATVNWLGYLLMRSGGMYEALPALLIVTTAEAGVHMRACSIGWLSGIRESTVGLAPSTSVLTKQISQVDSEADHNQSDHGAGREIDEFPVDDDDSFARHFDAECDQIEDLSRRSREGTDEDGRRYASGEVYVEMDIRQTTEQVVVGFCPAFDGDPNVDFEVDHADVTARLSSCTPAGMRIDLRRTSSDQPLELALEWYAVQVSADGTGLLDAQRTLP